MTFGIPSLFDQSIQAISDIILLQSDATAVANSFGPPQWGIFQNGTPIVTPDNIIAIEFRADWKIADYPVEGGAFQSYDKVVIPNIVKVTLSTGGSHILPTWSQITKIAKVTPTGPPPVIVDIVTPKLIYSSFCVNHVDTRRTCRGGVTLLTLDIWFLQIKVTVKSTTTKAPSGQDPSQGGNSNPTPAPSQADPTPAPPAPTTPVPPASPTPPAPPTPVPPSGDGIHPSWPDPTG